MEAENVLARIPRRLHGLRTGPPRLATQIDATLPANAGAVRPSLPVRNGQSGDATALRHLCAPEVVKEHVSTSFQETSEDE